jgi:hypothetical protein
MKFDERNQISLNPPFFCFHGNCGKVCPTDGYLQGVRHAAPYGAHFESKMTAKIQKSSDLGEIWYYYRHDKNKEHIFE